MEALTESMLSRLLPWVVLASLRFGTMLILLPTPFSEVAPARVRAALGVMLAFAVGIAHPPTIAPVHLEVFALGRAALGEVLVGSVIGLTVRVILAAADIAGSIAGMVMGLGFAASVDPLTGQQSVATSTVLNALATLIFFVIRGHHTVISTLAASLRQAPPGDAFRALSLHGMMTVGDSMLAQGLRISLPVIATMFIIQLSVGMVARIAPKVPLMTLSFAISIGAGILALYVASPSMASAIAIELGRLSRLLNDAFGAA